jgi:tetrahydromethanopterin S-methyltransferase subunit A
LLDNTLLSIKVIAGKICETILPVRLSYLKGSGKKVAICTLSDMSLLEEIIAHKDLMNKIVIAGRLLSENRGIDEILTTVHDSPDLKYLILCGPDGKGHLPGQALVSLSKFGVMEDGQIRGAEGAYPVVKSSQEIISSFRERIEIVDLIGSRDISQLELVVNQLNE